MTRAWIKLARDLWLTRGRVAFMVLALTAGLTSLGTVLSMYGVLQREMTRNYVDTVPASATFDIGGAGVTPALLADVRTRPEVAVAERRATLAARWRPRADAPWGRALVFVVEDVEGAQLARLRHEAGATAPPRDGVLVERSAMRVLGRDIGDAIQIAVGASPPATMTIAGVVHEPALAPAVTEQAAYLYVTPDGLARLGAPPVLDELRVLVAHAPLDSAIVDAQVESLGAWLVARGVDVHDIRVPPPGEHPHEAPSQGVLLLLAVFSGLTVALAAVLCASLLSLTMARQVREIAIMKTIGADSLRVRRLYGAMLALVALAALLLSAPATFALGRVAIDRIAALLNFDIASYAVPAWVYIIHIGAGLLLPLVAAAPLIARASRVDVRQALDDHGASPPANTRLERRTRGLRSRILQAAVRNALRVPRRFVLTVALLATAGGLFVSAVSIADAWDETTDQVFETRHYDVELELARAPSAADLADLPRVRRVEVWGAAPVTLASRSGLPISHTYPDGSHGSFRLLAAPDDTRLIDFAVRSGRWLSARDRDGVVLNQLAAARVGPHPLGREVDLVVEGRPVRLRVVGVVEEVAAPATAYVRTETFTRATGLEARILRVDAATPTAVPDIQRALAVRGHAIVAAIPLQLLFNAMGEHVVVLIRLLIGLALLMAVVGALALASTMSISVVERTREIGIMQAIGARPAQVQGMVVLEGVIAATASLLPALGLAAVLAAVVGRIVGQLSFALSLPLNLSWTAAAGWSAAIVVLAAAASVVPARAALARTVRDALSTV